MRRDYPDGNAKDLLANLEREGWVCRRIASAVQNRAGIPDAIVARKGPSHRNHLVEIKALGGRVRASQATFIQTWPGCVHIVTSSFEAALLLKECEERACDMR